MARVRYDLLHPKALRKAVIEHLGTDEDVPQERQFRRWVSGDTPVPGWARRVIDEVVGAPTREEAAPPDWAERLLTGVMALEEKGAISDEELARAEARAAIYLAANTQRRLRRGGGGGAAGSAA